MSNPYCTPEQFVLYYDRRLAGELSNDDNSRAADLTALQALLDAYAAKMAKLRELVPHA